MSDPVEHAVPGDVPPGALYFDIGLEAWVYPTPKPKVETEDERLEREKRERSEDAYRRAAEYRRAWIQGDTTNDPEVSA